MIVIIYNDNALMRNLGRFEGQIVQGKVLKS